MNTLDPTRIDGLVSYSTTVDRKPTQIMPTCDSQWPQLPGKDIDEYVTRRANAYACNASGTSHQMRSSALLPVILAIHTVSGRVIVVFSPAVSELREWDVRTVNMDQYPIPTKPSLDLGGNALTISPERSGISMESQSPHRDFLRTHGQCSSATITKQG